MRVVSKLLLVFVLFVGFSCCFSRVEVFGASESEAAVAISVAEGRVIDCYVAVRDAEGAGANVSALLLKLGEAGEFLSEAELSFRRGDFDSAFSLAGECQSRLGGVVDEAGVLAEEAVRVGYWDFVVTFGGSLGGVVAVGVCSFAGWQFLKRKNRGGTVG